MQEKKGRRDAHQETRCTSQSKTNEIIVKGSCNGDNKARLKSWAGG